MRPRDYRHAARLYAQVAPIFGRLATTLARIPANKDAARKLAAMVSQIRAEQRAEMAASRAASRKDYPRLKAAEFARQRADGYWNTAAAAFGFHICGYDGP